MSSFRFYIKPWTFPIVNYSGYPRQSIKAALRDFIMMGGNILVKFGIRADSDLSKNLKQLSQWLQSGEIGFTSSYKGESSLTSCEVFITLTPCAESKTQILAGNSVLGDDGEIFDQAMNSSITQLAACEKLSGPLEQLRQQLWIRAKDLHNKELTAAICRLTIANSPCFLDDENVVSKIGSFLSDVRNSQVVLIRQCLGKVQELYDNIIPVYICLEIHKLLIAQYRMSVRSGVNLVEQGADESRTPVLHLSGPAQVESGCFLGDAAKAENDKVGKILGIASLSHRILCTIQNQDEEETVQEDLVKNCM